jgi:bacillithiol biosynthesis cysteine-adding enzyme BshC
MPSSFFSFYLQRHMLATPLLPSSFGDRETRRQMMQRASKRRIAPPLASVLEATDARLPTSEARRAAIADLKRGNTAAVLTGQQVGLFLGPLYTIYKAATAVVLARTFERETGIRTVPIFWMATEDHDFDEIDHCTIGPQGGRSPLSLRVSADGRVHARQSVGELRLGADVAMAVDGVGEALQDRAARSAVLEEIAGAYRPGRTFAEAFAQLISSLFADEGLIVFDPRTQAVAELAAPVWRTALTESRAVTERLVARERALVEADLAPQVPVRDDHTLVFHHLPGPNGERRRVQSASTAILDELDRTPLSFSSSALLRPIVQDTLFPTAAYVGGPAEVSYFAQTAALYDLFGLPVPLVAPRARFRIVDARTEERLRRLGLTAAEAEGPRDEVLMRIGNRRGRPSPAAIRERLLDLLEQELRSLEAPLVAVDPGLERALSRTRGTTVRAIERLTLRFGRALALRDDGDAEALDRVRTALAPDGVPQERVYNFASFAAIEGPRRFVGRILSAIDPYEPSVMELRA